VKKTSNNKPARRRQLGTDKGKSFASSLWAK